MRFTTRRRFMMTGIAAIAGGSAWAPSAAAGGSDQYRVIDQTPFRGQTRRLKLAHNDRYVASLIFSTDYPTHFRLKPELFPVCTPAGLPVTSSHQYCFIHHQSIMCGHGKVHVEGRDQNVDFFRKLPFPDADRKDRWHSDFNLFTMGPSGIQRVTEARWTAGERISIELTLQWETRRMHREAGDAVLIETRRYVVFQRDESTVIDQFSQLTAADRPITLLADRHSLMGVRVHDLIDVEDGGVMIDSEGRVNPQGDYWDADGDRKAPRWVDCSGPLGDATVGMTLISHPNNLRNQFYVREYGVMLVSPTLGDSVHLRQGSSLKFAARFVAHDGPLNVQRANQLQAEFASS